MARPQVLPNAAGFFIFTLCYWALVRLFVNTAVEPRGWQLLYAACLTLAVLAWTRFAAAWSWRDWLLMAFYSAFLAMYFFFANMGLDVLHGVARRRSRPEDDLNGLELWFALFPGVFALTLGGVVRALLLRRSPARED